MNKKAIIVMVSAGLAWLGAVGVAAWSPSQNTDSKAPAQRGSVTEEVRQVCNGTSVTANCSLDGINYKSYVLHPAIEEKTHTETFTTYREEVTSYCTLCDDGTYSPTCATGRGACSHHGGVAQYGVPISESVPVKNTKTVVDTPAREAYYEKIAQ